MASDYGLNFGFRRSDESMAIREGRFKTPASGAALLQGVAVNIDPANPGYLKKAATGLSPVSGYHGLLVQEESHIIDSSNFWSQSADTPVHDSYDLGVCKLDQLSVIWSGNGTKVWFKNTLAYARGARSRTAVTMVTIAGVAVGDFLGWDGTNWVEVAAGPTAWMVVTNVATNYCEAVITF